MKREKTRIMPIVESVASIEGTRIGRVVRIDEGGQVFVDFSGSNSGPMLARATSSAKADLLSTVDPAGREVLLTFINNDPRLPVIVDTMHSLIDEIAKPSSEWLDKEEPQEVIMDGKRIVFEAEQEIVLKCGKASITLTRVGKVLIRGEYVLSHSSGENRIRGGSVSVN